MKKTLIALSIATLIIGCATDDSENMGAPDRSTEAVGGASGTLAAQDSTFAREAMQAGMAEVKMGQLAAKNSQNEAVRKYGQRLVDDHTKANQELKQIASRKSVSIESQLSQQHQSALDRLTGLKDNEFDQAFKQQAIQDHQKVIQLFEKQSQQGSDADLKAYAQKHLPHLREHLTMAQQLGGTDKGETSPTGREESTEKTGTEK